MTGEKFEVIIVPSFQKEIERIKERKQLELIYKSIEKLERWARTQSSCFTSGTGIF